MRIRHITAGFALALGLLVTDHHGLAAARPTGYVLAVSSLEETVLSVGITHESLAAAGATPAVLAAWADGLTEAACVRAIAELAGAKIALASCHESVTRGEAIPAETLAARKVAVAQAEADAIAALTAALPESVRDRARTLAGNRARPVPLQYRAVDRPEAEWAKLREALSAVRAAQRRGVPAPAECVQMVQLVDAQTEVALAVQNLTAGREGLRVAWREEFPGGTR